MDMPLSWNCNPISRVTQKKAEEPILIFDKKITQGVFIHKKCNGEMSAFCPWWIIISIKTKKSVSFPAPFCAELFRLMNYLNRITKASEFCCLKTRKERQYDLELLCGDQEL